MASRTAKSHPPARGAEDQGYLKPLRKAVRKHAPALIAIERIEHQHWCDILKPYGGLHGHLCNCSAKVRVRVIDGPPPANDEGLG